MNTGKDIRQSLKIMREFKKLGVDYIYEKPITKKLNIIENKHLTMREMLGRMRKLKEDDGMGEKTITPLDKKTELEKIQRNFDDLEVNVSIEDFEVYDNGVFLSGTIDDQITFTYSVSPTEEGSGVEWTASQDFDSNNKDNDEVIKRLESYYNEFYKYWRDNELNK